MCFEKANQLIDLQTTKRANYSGITDAHKRSNSIQKFPYLSFFPSSLTITLGSTRIEISFNYRLLLLVRQLVLNDLIVVTYLLNLRDFYDCSPRSGFDHYSNPMSSVLIYSVFKVNDKKMIKLFSSL